MLMFMLVLKYIYVYRVCRADIGRTYNSFKWMLH